MRINNLKKEDAERIKRGDMFHLGTILKAELEGLKEDLIYLPEERIKELRGKAVAIATIIELLPKR